MTDQNTPVPQQGVPSALPSDQTSPPVPQGAAPDSDEKFFAAVAYLGPLFILTLLVKPKSAFCKFHARQSMVLFLAFIVFLVVLATNRLIGSLITFVLFAAYVLAMYRAYIGDMWAIPVVSKFTGKMDIDAIYRTAGVAVSGISQLKDKATDLASGAAQAAQNLGKQNTPAEPGAAPETPQAPPASIPPVPPVPPVPPAAPQVK